MQWQISRTTPWCSGRGTAAARTFQRSHRASNAGGKASRVGTAPLAGSALSQHYVWMNSLVRPAQKVDGNVNVTVFTLYVYIWVHEYRYIHIYVCVCTYINVQCSPAASGKFVRWRLFCQLTLAAIQNGRRERSLAAARGPEAVQRQQQVARGCGAGDRLAVAHQEGPPDEGGQDAPGLSRGGHLWEDVTGNLRTKSWGIHPPWQRLLLVSRP